MNYAQKRALPDAASQQTADLNSSPIQRRQWDRRQINLPCQVATRGSCFDATIRNISQGGALLDGAPPMIRGTQLLITIQSGREIAASVVWHAAHSVGVKFDAEILADDPLLCGPNGD